MKLKDYAQLNTLIDVYQNALLTASDYENLLVTPYDERLISVLEDARYPFTLKELHDLDQIERRLMNALIADYRFAYEYAPEPLLVDVFGAYYIFHNLKAIMKMLTFDLSLEDLLIPIGHYSNESLYYMVRTGDSEVMPSSMIESIRYTLRELNTYQDSEVIDIGMDMAYFDHLRYIEETLNDEHVTAIVNARIEFYNVTTAKRAENQGQTHGFKVEMMTDKGIHTIDQIIEFVQNDELTTWFNQINALPYDTSLAPFLEKMENGTMTSGDLEQMENEYIARYIDAQQFSQSSVIPLLNYLFNKEIEIKNLRLILTNRLNGIDSELIEERMIVIHDE